MGSGSNQNVLADEIASTYIGQNAADFSLNDVSGQPFSLADYSQTPILVAFVSTQCGYCKALYPHLKTFHQQNSRIQIIMVAAGTPEELQDLVIQEQFDFPVLAYDSTTNLGYEVPGTPFFYAIDEGGIIRQVGFANTLAHLNELTKPIRS